MIQPYQDEPNLMVEICSVLSVGLEAADALGGLEPGGVDDDVH